MFKLAKSYKTSGAIKQLVFNFFLLALATTQAVSAQQTALCTLTDIDRDDDGLIDICDLEGLNAMRYALDGSGYKTTEGATVITTGCPSDGCTGYELTRSLDFKDDNSYRNTANTATYTVSNYDDSEDKGWQPIGVGTAFTATFDGNGYAISNLMINRSGEDQISLFAFISVSKISNLGLLNVNIIGRHAVSGLASNNFGTITNSYVTGSVSGSSTVGGLVGNTSGIITNSYATGEVTGSGDDVGGLVGSNRNITVDPNNGSITNSYAMASASGVSNVGGLVGNNVASGTITNSYATGKARGSGANVGGLVGNNAGTIEDSYWLSSSASSAGTGDTSTSQTAIELTSPTTPTMMTYSNWSTNDWDFGRPTQYPALKYATDCANPQTTLVKSNIGPPICGTVLLNQQVNTSIQIRVKVFLEGSLQ